MEYVRLASFFATSVGLSAEGLRDPQFHARQRAAPDLRPKLHEKGAEETHNHYKTLGVGWDAPPEVIRKNYKQLALFYHPDKQSETNADASAQFSSVSEAYAVLSDPLRRLVYDLVLGIRDKTDKEIIKMAQLKMDQALEDVANMECTVPLKREQEEKKKGLVIVNATYGLLQDATGPLTTLNSDADDITSIDVTVPVQCMVEDSSLVIPAGESKAWLAGFYDPCIGEPKQLRVRYLFWGRLHEVVINDEDQLKIPIKGHLLGDEVQFRAQLSPSNRRKSTAGNNRRASFINPRRGSLHFQKHLEEQDERNRRFMWWVAVFAGGAACALFVRRKQWAALCDWIAGAKSPATDATATATTVEK